MSNKNEIIRIDKFLGNLGYGSRKEIKGFIKAGLVSVDSEIISRADFKVSTKTSQVELDGELIDYKEYVYLIMNKPAGVISATSDPYGETPVTELLPDDYYYLGLAPVGRLDKDAVGLLLLTNDGKYNHMMTSPKKGILKTYYAVVTGSYDENNKQTVKDGVVLDDGYKCRPGELYTLEEYIAVSSNPSLKQLCREYLPDDIPSSNTYEAIIKISEGKFHQVKRMFAAMGQTVVYLKRIEFGGYILPADLAEGECIEIFPNN